MAVVVMVLFGSIDVLPSCWQNTSTNTSTTSNSNSNSNNAIISSSIFYSTSTATDVTSYMKSKQRERASRQLSTTSLTTVVAAVPEIPLWPDPNKIPGERRRASGTNIMAGNETTTCGSSISNKPPPAVSSSSSSPLSIPQDECLDKHIRNVNLPTLIPFLANSNNNNNNSSSSSDTAVIIAPGGAYNLLAVDREGTDIALWLNSLNIHAFVLKYRVPERPWLDFGQAPLLDAQRSVRLVRQMAQATNTTAMEGKQQQHLPRLPNLNPSKIGFMGFSAGAHLAGHLNVAWKQPKQQQQESGIGRRSYQSVDDIDDKISCRPDFAIMVYPWRSVSQEPVREQPLAIADQVTNETPPTLLIQAQDDWAHVENSIYYYQALQQHGSSNISRMSELHVYPNGGHGFGRCTMPGMIWHEICTWTDRAEAFFKTLGVLRV